MRLIQRSIERRLAAGGLAALTLGLAVLAGCGGSDDDAALPAEQVAAFSSPYCVTARQWAVHELDGGGDGAYASGGPPALRKWWGEQLAYLKTSLSQAPPEVRSAEALNERVIRTRLTPIMEKYGFDYMRATTEASDSERALVQDPPRKVAKAQAARNAYQNRVCGYGGSPPAADVTFAPSPAAKPYCKAVAAQNEAFENVVSSGFDPEALRSYVSSDGFLQALHAQDATAPADIADDVEADIAWVRTRKLELLEQFDYDLRRIMLEGSAEEVAAWNYFDPEIVGQESRVVAYQEQVCGAGS